MSAVYASYLNTGGTPVVEMGVPRQGPPFNVVPSPYEPSLPQPTIVDPNTGTQMVPVPFPSLESFGVQRETVRQLTEMKAYLWRHVRNIFLHLINLIFFLPLFSFI
jgi:hypothetical protein